MIGREECSRFYAFTLTLSLAVLFVHIRLYSFTDVKGFFIFLIKGGLALTSDEKAAWATEQLCKRQRELGRLPKKEDFDDRTRSRIKAFLGPWPRALEKAGLKPFKAKSRK